MRPLTSRLALFAVVVATLAGMGVAHGLLTYRWAPPDTHVPLDRLPFTIGDWDGTPVDAGDVLPDFQDDTVVLRRYVNRVNGDALTLFLTAGPTVPMLSSHTPEACYPGAGFSRADPIVTKNIVTEPGSRTNQFRVADYSKTERASPRARARLLGLDLRRGLAGFGGQPLGVRRTAAHLQDVCHPFFTKGWRTPGRGPDVPVPPGPHPGIGQRAYGQGRTVGRLWEVTDP